MSLVRVYVLHCYYKEEAAQCDLLGNTEDLFYFLDWGEAANWRDTLMDDDRGFMYDAFEIIPEFFEMDRCPSSACIMWRSGKYPDPRFCLYADRAEDGFYYCRYKVFD